jgi:hypothetical protein
MLVLPDFGRPYVLDSLTSPVVIKHHWVFKAPVTDFMLEKLEYLEETTGACIKVRINNSEFWVPATWNILVTDTETYQLDTVSIQACASTQHLAFSFSTDEMNLRTLPVKVIEYAESMALVHPMINKGCALVHPVGPAPTFNGKQLQLSVVIGPHDLYKHLQGKVVGDVMSW